MSWFFGTKRISPSSNIPSESIPNILGISSRPVVCNKDLVIYSAGPGETCLSSDYINPENKNSGWIVCGLGIKEYGGDFSYMTEKSWDRLLKKESFTSRNLNGHYAIVRWKKSSVELFTDTLGLRRIYLMECEGLIYFSTRLDWLLPFRKNNEIDFSNLGSLWSLLASYTHTSIIKDTTRLGPGSHAVITDSISISNTPWSPSPAPGDTRDCGSLLEKLACLPLKHDKKIMLSLSGGLDCRTILSVLMKYPRDTWSTYSVEEKDHPDILVAQDMSRSLGFTLHTVCEGNSDPSYQINMCREMALHMEMTFSLYLLNYFHRLSEFNKSDYWIVDGGYGEYLRRIYCNHLIHYGKKHLLQMNIPEIARLLKGDRPPVFNEDIMNRMEHSAIEHIDLAANSLPEISEIGIENWIDLLQIRYRITNGPANSHGFFDSYIPNYMPFAQPAMLNLILSIPPGKKNNSAINRQIIKENAPQLTRFPLVRDSAVTPYFSARNNYLSKIWTLGARKLGRQYNSIFPQKMLINLKEPVYDRLLSSEVSSYAPYNYPFIKKLVSDFYEKGKKENSGAIYDWLAFDFWREAL